MKGDGASLSAGAVVLAAGSGTRMGALKQLLPYRGRPLVLHAVNQALEAGLYPVVVVAGAEPERVREAVAGAPVEISENPHWESGMGSSIAAGVRRLAEAGPGMSALAILLADQPLVTAQHLQAMRTRMLATGADIVAAQYSGTIGVPAFFRASLISLLCALPPQAGARHLLRNSSLNVQPFALPEAAADIDTPEDFAKLEGPAEAATS